jgi:hypothetical protein
MSFSINPLEFLKMMTERQKKSREQVVEWLEAVQRDGRLLSDTWIKVAAYMRENPGKVPDDYHPIMREQLVFCSRLDGFYEYASAAVEGRLETTFWNGFVDHLGGVLYARGKARALRREFIQEQKILLTCVKDMPTVDTMQEAIETLQTELASLDVFIQTIKASPKAIR